MFHGLPGWDEMAPRPLFPVPQTPHDAPRAPHEADRTENGRAIRSSTGKKVRRRKPNERKSIKRAPASAEPGGELEDRSPRTWIQESTSDSEAGGAEARLRAAQARVRQAALVLLHSVVSFSDKRHMLGFWPSLVPDTPHVPARTLMTVVLQDPAARCRLGAASVLREMLDSSRFFLTGVDDRVPAGPAPFTPYSVTMACLVKELHRGLLLALLAEKSPLTLAAVLRALATLVANAPYHRLRVGLLTKVSRHVRAFLSHRNHDVKMAALSVLINVVSIHEPLPEVFQLLRAPSLLDEASSTDARDSATSADEVTADAGDELELLEDDDEPDEEAEPGAPAVRSWLWVRCRAFVLRQRDAPPATFFYPTPVRLQAMRTLCALAKNYFAAVAGCLPEVSALLERCMCDEDMSVRLHGAHLLECVGDAAAAVASGAAAYDLWLAALARPLPALFAPDQKPFVRAAACHALSTLGAGVFERLPRDKQLLCVTLLLPLAADEEGSVRCAAVRAAGVFVRLPSLADDPGYLLDTAEAACAPATAAHPFPQVRINAVWTLANLTDSLVQRPAWQPLATVVLANMTAVALRAASDSDKVKVNAVRALGNLLRHFPAEVAADGRIAPLVPNCVAALVRCMSTGNSVIHMKVRWNACYAASNVFKNGCLPFATAAWRPPLIEALCKLASNFKNFKVRINAALALASPTDRTAYGDQFLMAWSRMLEALETAQNITDFNEFKHRDTLLRQVCLTLCHLAALLQAADLAQAADALAAHLETVTAHMSRLPSALLPEQSAPLLAARENLRLLKQNRGGALSADKTEALKLLSDVFEATVDDHHVL
ncbi:HEAT repeat-containing protein 6-like [Pollicipes pollicipes]|uniref:HEAT repeat-containing protein 6-like n=1 Tax=Pollicipes pollicipes TaxID=41117 RepID=UPI0018855C5C|nr:HEAT repeat-containing protein 6-like [Pollicipes pollicipes]